MTDVEVHIGDRGNTVLAGIAHFTRQRGRVTTTFTYAPRACPVSPGPRAS